MSDREQGQLADWLCALDDVLTARWRLSGCTTCGARPIVWEEIRSLPGHSVAVQLCDACHVGDRTRVKLDAVLQTRYGNGNGHARP